MTEPEPAFGEILTAAEQFLDEGDYERVVIQANRLLTVSTLWVKSPMAANVAIALRLAGQDLNIASMPDGKVDITQKQEFERLLGSFRTLTSAGSEDFSAPWTRLATFKAAFWSKSLGALEGRAYSSNSSLVAAVLKWAEVTLKEASGLVSTPRGSPFVGVANEVDWVVRAFGATPKQIADYAILSALAWQSEYERWRNNPGSSRTTSISSTSGFSSIVERALDLIQSDSERWNEIGQLLSDLGGQWRNDFSIFFDLYAAAQERSQRRSMGAPEESKEGQRGFRKERQGKER